MPCTFDGCESLKDINPFNFQIYDFTKLNNQFIKGQYPELYI